MPWEAVQSSSLNVFVTRFGRFMGDQISEEVSSRTDSVGGEWSGLCGGCGSWMWQDYLIQIYSISLTVFRIRLGNFMDDKITYEVSSGWKSVGDEWNGLW